MRIRHIGYIAVLAAFSLSAEPAPAKCQLQQIGALPVEMHDQPLVSTKINGTTARFVLDSGSFYSSISRDAAMQYRLPITDQSGGTLYIEGLGGTQNAEIATVQAFGFLGMNIPKVHFLVIDQRVGDDSVIGLLGQNLLRFSDLEYDLADGNVRFFRPVDCNSQPLAYWAAGAAYTSVDLQSMDFAEPHLRTTAMVNGHRVTVEFDTGTSRSMLSLRAAERAGITPASPDVRFLGITSGIGAAPVKMWVAPVDAFQIGGEKVQHTHLLIEDLDARYVSEDFPELILGDDFFLSHRIYVAYSQRKLYFTYNGGPLFNLDVPGTASNPARPPASPEPNVQQTAATNKQSSNTPTDADGFKRRGMAYASMRDYDRALADLTHACELAPHDAEDRYDRGVIYTKDNQFKSALEDFNAALTLQPNDIDALVARAELLWRQPDAVPAGAPALIKADLDAASRLASPAADVRLTLSDLYGKLRDYADGIDQVDQWLSNHPLKSDQATGLNRRCRLRATVNRDLQAALDDCTRALALRPYDPAETGSLIDTAKAPENPYVLDNRGLVYLRLGNLRDAIRDYDSALHINSNMPSSLYGRGLAELRLGEKAQGQADLAAAEKLDSGITRRFATMGLAP